MRNKVNEKISSIKLIIRIIYSIYLSLLLNKKKSSFKINAFDLLLLVDELSAYLSTYSFDLINISYQLLNDFGYSEKSFTFVR